jgi:hypothetical protein
MDKTELPDANLIKGLSKFFRKNFSEKISEK